MEDPVAKIIEIVSNGGALLVSIIALWISFKSYSQSVPRLLLNMWLGQQYNVPTKKTLLESSLVIQVVNASSRPVTIKGLGGHYNNLVSRTLRKRVPWLQMPTSFYFTDIKPIIFDQTGEPRILADGQAITHMLPTKKGNGDLAKVKGFFVVDAAGREYQLPRNSFRNLMRQFAALNAEEEPN